MLGLKYWVFLISIALVQISFITSTGNDPDTFSPDSTEEEEEEPLLSRSIATFTHLHKSEKYFINKIHDLLLKLREKLLIMNEVLSEIYAEHETVRQDAEYYLSNPLYSFRLLRRLRNDWLRLIKYVNDPIEEMKSMEIIENLVPPQTELINAVNAIKLIQDVYNVRTSDFAKGIIKGKQYPVQFSSIDCFAMAELLRQEGNEREANEWLSIALQKYQDSNLYKILDYDLYKILRSEDFNSYKSGLAQSLLLGSQIITPLPDSKQAYIETDELEAFRKGCRDELNHEAHSRLQCHLRYKTNAFLTLAPFKVEVISEDPYISIFYDVLSEREIEEIKTLALPSLEDARVYSDTGDAIIAEGRTAKGSHFSDDFNPTIIRINQRIEDMTGLTVKNAEDFHPVNYGIGGHYVCHMDWFSANETNEPIEHGLRFATVLFYLSDVEQGGETVFPHLNIKIPARKGTAAFWYNMKNDSENGDDRMEHCSCPAIVGSKWIAVKWILADDQMFRKPCMDYTK